MMDVGRKKGGASTSNVISGSVWESRMKMDEVKGGIKVFNGEDGNKEARPITRAMSKRSPTGNGAVSAKRKAWNSDASDGSEKSPTQISKGKTESKRNCDEQCKEIATSVEGIKKSPIQVRKLRSEGSVENPVAAGKIERSPIQIRKSKSELANRSSELSKEIRESGERNEKNPIQLRKVKSDSIRTSNDNAKAIVGLGERNAENSEELENSESESNEEEGEVEKGIDESVKEIEKTQVEIGSNGSDETCKEFGVCHISTNTEAIKSAQKQPVDDTDAKDENEDDEGDEEEEEETDEEVDIEIEKKSFDIKEISLPAPKKVVNEVKRFHQVYEKPVQSFSTTVKQSPPIHIQSPIYRKFSRPTQTSDENHSFQEKNTKLQSFVDLIMWKDVSRSAFVFGIGSFLIISSSYTKDINISFISVMSYLGLFYLAATFLYRSIICRGVIEMENMSHVVGEEEAIWVLKLILPYLNEFLLKLRALFCGDPSTTMKLAVLLFGLARCGSSITIWKVAKWGFFGVFTVPKICSSYSSQLAAYAKFWVRRFRDAWESCSHKKGVAVAIFVLVWNLSSVVARIWAAFMLFVAFRYYQQSLLRDEWEEDEVHEGGDTCQSSIGSERLGRGSLFVNIANSKTNTKQKKKY